MMSWTGNQAKALAEALVTAIPSHEELRQVVRYGLGQSLDTLALGRDLREVVGKLVEAVAAQPDGVTRLVAAAREARPTHPGLAAIAQELGLAPLIPAAAALESALEREVDPLSRLVDLPAWLSRAGRLEAQVCLIELCGKPQGTGFLVGPDTVMTNYHVVETVIDGSAAAVDLTLVFDYKQDTNGTIVNPGVRYALAAPGWQIDASPYHPAELAGGGGETPTPNPDQLDYALLRTAKTPGMDPVGGTLGPPRGWIVPKAADYAFSASDVLYVVQHPHGAPLKIAVGTVIGLNTNGTRVAYRPTTDKGSSGSPVFNRDWELVALHHGGFKAHNQGIPIAAITRLLTARGHAAIFSAALPPAAPPRAIPAHDGQLMRVEAETEKNAGGLIADPLVALSGQALEELDEALRSAFDRARLGRLLAYRLGTNLADVAPGQATYLEDVQAVIAWAVREGKIRQLVAQARDMNAGNAKLKVWEERYLLDVNPR